jgi:hypothetical protein
LRQRKNRYDSRMKSKKNIIGSYKRSSSSLGMSTTVFFMYFIRGVKNNIVDWIESEPENLER